MPQKFYTTIPRYDSQKRQYVNGSVEAPLPIFFADNLKVSKTELDKGALLTEEQYQKRMQSLEEPEQVVPPFNPALSKSPPSHTKDRR